MTSDQRALISELARGHRALATALGREMYLSYAEALETVVAETVSTNTYHLVVEDCHQVLDAAGVPKADGARCPHTNCNSLLGHRVRTLVEERDRLFKALCHQYDSLEALRKLIEHARKP